MSCEPIAFHRFERSLPGPRRDVAGSFRSLVERAERHDAERRLTGTPFDEPLFA